MYTFFTLKLVVSEIAAFFCDLDDIAKNGYTKADKRDVLKPMEVSLDWEECLRNNYPEVQLEQKREITCELSDLALKFSIDDLCTFKKIL